MNREAMVELWTRHTHYEFEMKDADLAVSTMAPKARVMHLPTMSGASGREALRAKGRHEDGPDLHTHGC